MTAILIVGGLVAALLLVSLLRVGGTAEYSQTGLLVRVRLGPVRLTVYPARAKKAGKKQKKSVSDAPEESVKSGGSFAQFKRFLPLITDAAGRLKHKIRVDTLNLDFTAASQNPAAAALEFGYANAAIGMLFPLL
ncbi:MAG: DUF2953 domain-containing protein, partial [Pseudoflavonifractor sp.]